MDKKSTILVTGSNGTVGKTLVLKLKEIGFSKILVPSSKHLDLRKQDEADKFFKKNKIDYVFHLAAKVGGIAANMKSPAEFLYDNLTIGTNVIEAARRYNVKKLLNLGSSCIYPKECKQPMKEEFLLSGKLEPTNEGYALAKISILRLCEYYNKQYGTNFINLMPPNIYGPGDHFDLEKSHVISALITKFHEGKVKNKEEVVVWGTGKARREFLFVEDVCDAMIYFMEKYDNKDIDPFINVGFGGDISIKDLAKLIKEITGYKGKIKFDTTKPDGMMKKLLDTKRSNKLGWKAKVELREGIEKTYKWYKENF